MAYANTVLSQFLKYFSRSDFDKLEKKHHKGAKLRSASRWDQFVFIIVGQLTGRSSLRDIVEAARSQARKFYHAGAKLLPRSTFSRLNNQYSYELYEDMFNVLLKRCKPISPKHKFRFKNPLYSMDATTIDLCLSLFPWAKFRKKKSGIKLNVTLNHNGFIPEFVDVSNAKSHEIKLARLVKLPEYSIVTFDRGYICFDWLKLLDDENIYFVTRPKKSIQFKIMERRVVNKKSGITSDHIVILLSKNSNKKYPSKMRRIGYKDPETKKQYYFLTNNFTLAAKTIADIYKDRWQIELFFKWIKQNLKIKKFIGRSRNAVLTQIWISLCVYLVILFSKFINSIRQSPTRILRLVCINCFERRDFMSIFDPPPSKDKEKLELEICIQSEFDLA